MVKVKVVLMEELTQLGHLTGVILMTEIELGNYIMLAKCRKGVVDVVVWW